MNKHKYIILETRVLYKLYDKKSLFVVQVGPPLKPSTVKALLGFLLRFVFV